MPKKSKKDKIAADSRRRFQAEKMSSYSFVKPPTDGADKTGKLADTSAVTKNEKPAGTGQNKIHNPEHRHLKRDLIKIIIFTIFALSFQGVLYFFLRG